jgi:hypothetical protein
VIDSQFSTVVCAPIYSKYDGFTTQVEIGVDEGLKHDSAIYCDELVSLPKFMLTDFIGSLSPLKVEAINNRAVQKPQFLNSFGNGFYIKTAEFAAILRQIPYTCERTEGY